MYNKVMLLLQILNYENYKGVLTEFIGISSDK
jgi:hypothetical protein